MSTIERIINDVRNLNPDEIRARLAELDKEARTLRTLLRAAIRQANRSTREIAEGRQ